MSKSTFYTNIERRGNSILYMGYENGLPVKKKIKYQPHVWISSPNNEPTSHRAFSTKEYVKKISFESMSDMNSYIDTYKGISNFRIFGCSDLYRQFTWDVFPEKINWSYEQTQIWFFDIETRTEGLSCDVLSDLLIRCDGKEYSIGYKQAMRMMENDISFEIFEGDQWVNVKKSSIYVAGFPDPDVAPQEILLISMMNHHSGKIILWSNKLIDDDNEDFVVDHVNKKLTLKHSDEYETNHKHITDYDIVIRQFDMDEKSMLKDYLRFMSQIRIDILSGWNSESFDIPYIVNRIKKVVGEDFVSLLSPWGIVKPRTYKDAHEKVRITYDIYGVSHIDYMEIFKKFNPGARESFKLDFIAMEEIGHGKKELPGESFKENYVHHWHKFVLYNIIDTHLLHQLEKQLLQVRLAMQIAFYAHCNFSDVVSAMRVWESIIYGYFLNEINMVEDWEKSTKKSRKIVGAYVHDPKVGKYGWTVSIDATSLYPSIMMQNNISPEMIVDIWPDFFIDDMLAGKHIGNVPEGCIVSANGLVTKKGEWGFIPTLVKRMFDMRKTMKNEMLNKKKQAEDMDEKNSVYEKLLAEIASLDVAQQSFKVNANSFYGILAMMFFRYYDPYMGEAVTSTGQVFIKKTKFHVDSIFEKILKKKGDYVFYCDTDSAYIHMQDIVDKYCQGKTDDEIVTFLEKFVFDVIQPELNKNLSADAKTMGIDDCKISFKLECIGPSLIMCAKKKYMFDILYSEGVRYKEPKMKVMGIEIVRSSTPGKVKDYLKTAAKICLSGKESDLQEYVKQVKKDFFALHYTQASFPRGCNGIETYSSDTTIYGHKTPIHVRGALIYNHYLHENGLDTKYPLIQDGDRVKFIMMNPRNPFREDVISFPSKLPEEFHIEKYIDWRTQYQKAFIVPLKNITDKIGWHLEKQPDEEFLFG